MQSVVDGKLYLSWVDIEEAIGYLCNTLAYNHFKPELILALSRGGSIPGVMLSHALGVPVEHFRVSSYEGEEQKKVRFELPFHPRDFDTTFMIALGRMAVHWDKRSTLILDDLWDSGETMRAVGQAFPEVLRATLFYKGQKQHPLPPINFPGQYIGSNWIVFPWEKD